MTDATYRKRAAEFNEKMGLGDPVNYREDALVRFSVIAEEVGELMEAINKGREDEIPEELADVVITLYTGADTLDIKLPENVEANDLENRYRDEAREQISDLFMMTGDIKRAIDMIDKGDTRLAMIDVLRQCQSLAEFYDIDLHQRFHEKMDYNMQKSGAKVNGKPVDDVK